MVAVFADLGVEIVDEAPDASIFFPPAESAEDEDAAVDEFAAALAAGSDDSRPSQDLMRAYMRQMGNAELLTREQEVALAKRLEEGLAERLQALTACPAASAYAIELAERVETGELGMHTLVARVVRDDDGEEPINFIMPLNLESFLLERVQVRPRNI